MKTCLNLWNIHYWLLQKNIPHLYTFEDELETFSGIRFYTPETETGGHAVLFNEPHSHQYASVLSYRNSRIYFQQHDALQAMNLLDGILSEYHQVISELQMMNINRMPISELLRTISDYLSCPVMILYNARVVTCTPDQDQLITQVKDALFNVDLKKTLAQWARYSKADSFSYPKIIHLHDMPPILLDRLEFQGNYIWILGIDVKHQMPCSNLNLFNTLLEAVYHRILQPGSGILEYTMDETDTCLLSFVNQVLPSKSSIQHTMNRLHWKRGDTYTVYRIELYNYSDSLILDQLLCRLGKMFPHTHSLINGYGIYLFCNKTLSGRLITEEDFDQVLPLKYVYIGQSNIQDDFTVLPVLIRQSLEAVSHGRKQNQHFLFTQEIFKEMLYAKLNDDRMLRSLIHPAVGKLIRLDNEAARKGYYLETLKCFLLSGANISSAAKKLDIHRNTLISRLEKIQMITHLDLSDSETLEALLQSILFCPPDSSAD